MIKLKMDCGARRSCGVQAGEPTSRGAVGGQVQSFIGRTLALFLGSTLVASLPPVMAQDDTPPVQVVAAPSQPLDALLQPLTEDNLFRDATVALQVVDTRTGEEVYGWHQDDSLVPASTMKVITAATALKELGPSYRWTTEVLTDGKIGDDGVLRGNLYVKGSGDPEMVVETLWKLAYDLKLEGVNEVQGDIVFDDSAMTSERGIPGWKKKVDLEDGPAYNPSLGALSLNFNTVAVVVAPSETVGGDARVQLETPAPGILSVESELTTTAKGGRRHILLERAIDGRKMTLKLGGSIPQGTRAQKYYRSVADPTAYFQGAMANMLTKHGVKVRGKWREDVTPEKTKLLVRHRSSALANVLASTNKHSNNFMAEQVLKTLGMEIEGEGSTEAGIRVVDRYLQGLGIAPEEYTLVNGSGLARGIRIRPSHLTAVLVDMEHDDQVGAEFRSSLAIGGRDGTLWARFREDDQVGRLRGKTGTINGVHCLTGYIDSEGGDRFAFAFLVNDLPYSIARARQAHDRFADVLFDLGAEPDLDEEE
jgi:serine-type D-Ala-D-Ala carboxypeptidase/endopeptidase (penicillin-binding protein 4)